MASSLVKQLKAFNYSTALRFWLITVVACLAIFARATTEALELKPGDVISIRIIGADRTDDLEVLSDGSIQSHEFGSVMVGGLTLDQTTKLLTKRLSATRKDPKLSVILKAEAPRYAFLSGAKTGGGLVKLLPDMDVRKLLSGAEFSENVDEYDAHFFRQGQPERTATLQAVLLGSSDLANQRLKSGDVVSVLPAQFVRVWVTGAVKTPGEYAVRTGGDVYRALALAGGVLADAIDENDTVVTLRRGPNNLEFPARQDPKAPGTALEAGDTLVVNYASQIAVTVAGEVKTPGLVKLHGGSTLDQAIASSGGITKEGTGRGIQVLRNGKKLTANAASSTSSRNLGSFKIEDHDVILVPQNNDYVIAVGEVKTPGRAYIPDGQRLRLLDAIVSAGGVAQTGTLRHVFVGRPDGGGQFKIKEYHVDRYVKSGDESANPYLETGDVITVLQSQPSTLQTVQTALSSAFLLYGISRAIQ
jgi:protein involved in polysaccharide export with SLBB domain